MEKVIPYSAQDTTIWIQNSTIFTAKPNDVDVLDMTKHGMLWRYETASGILQHL